MGKALCSQGESVCTGFELGVSLDVMVYFRVYTGIIGENFGANHKLLAYSQDIILISITL
jgi:hypothetical protein